MIYIDGSKGEGGGQILRSALSLSILTQKPFTIEHIRAGRAKPGLLRQHLTALKAAAQICGGKYSDDVDLGASRLSFYPSKIKGGTYEFAIGSAGSALLVLQTILLPLLFADKPSRALITGGTHNPAAPPFEFIERAYLPLLRQMGADVQIKLIKYGFMPAGGGRIMVEINPTHIMRPVEFASRGQKKKMTAEAFFANLPFDVAQRELGEIQKYLSLHEKNLFVREVKASGPGNAVVLTFESEFVTEVFTAFGRRGVMAEDVALQSVQELQAYFESRAAIGEHLADQLLLPMALAGGGSFTTTTPSMHTKTNAQVIEQFLPVQIKFEQNTHSDAVTISIHKT